MENIATQPWNLSAYCHTYTSRDDPTYDAEKDSCVWPPMLLMITDADLTLEEIKMSIGVVSKRLSKLGVQRDTVTQIECVCWEGNCSYHLLVLPPSGLSFLAAKDVDNFFHARSGTTWNGRDTGMCEDIEMCCYYPSLKDVIDIKNGRIPESSRRFFCDLNYHGMARQSCNDLGVDLLRDDGICVGRGICQKFREADCVDDEVLGDLQVGVRVLEIVEDLLPAEWKGSLRRWRTTHALHNGVSLFECFRQLAKLEGSVKSDDSGESEDSEEAVESEESEEADESEESNSYVEFCGPVFLKVQKAEGVLKNQSITSVAPRVSSGEDDGDEMCSLSSECFKTCRDAIDAIEKSTSTGDREGPRLHDGKSFAMKLEIDDSSRRKQIKNFINAVSKRRTLMEHLGIVNCSGMARDVVRRLEALHELSGPGVSSNSVTSMTKKAEEMELSTLHSIGVQAKLEILRKSVMSGLGSEIEKFVSKRKEEQHQELLKELANTEDRHLSKVEEIVSDRLKFLESVDCSKKETESIQEWVAHHVAIATENVKKKHRADIKKLEEQLMEKLRWESELAKAYETERSRWREQMKKTEIELNAAKKELANQMNGMPKCAICFENLEGATIKSGQKRSRDDVLQRGCFTPCMHTNMCLGCSVQAWDKFKRCPVCSTACPTKPYAIYM